MSPCRVLAPPRRAATLLVVAVLLGGCATQLPSPEAQARRYAAAVADAESATTGEVVRDLWAVAAGDPRLVWEGEPGASRVRVVAWTAWTGYDAHLGADCGDCTGRPVWVTLVPEVRSRCRRFPRRPDALRLRLTQLLGLPPGATNDRFVELWVDPGDLYRPCPDPEVSDRACEVTFPVGAYAAVPDDYRGWFEANFATYTTDPPYPWTRLGYTYDWGGRNEVGASELVIRQGATVGVAAIAATTRYCDRR